MIFYYALGGGLGHVTRAQSLIHTLGLKSPVTLAMTSSWLDEPLPISDQFQQLQAPKSLSKDPQRLKTWLKDHFAQESYHLIIIDAFPGGLLGELCNFTFPEEAQLFHCARRLKWSTYAEIINDHLPSYHRCFLLESIEDHHMQKLKTHCTQIDALHLIDPPSQTNLDEITIKQSGEILWLIVHAGSSDEIIDLISFAQESAMLEKISPRFVLISPQRPHDLPDIIEYYRMYPALAWFEKADRIFSACGYNTVRQLYPYRAQHRFIPMPRRFDDQYARATSLRSGEWDTFQLAIQQSR